jgi:hypothetical protein
MTSKRQMQLDLDGIKIVPHFCVLQPAEEARDTSDPSVCSWACFFFHSENRIPPMRIVQREKKQAIYVLQSRLYFNEILCLW